MLIYHFEQHSTYAEAIRPVFELIDRGLLEAITSTVTLLEVLVHPIRQGRSDLVEAYTRALTRSRGLRLLPLDRWIARRGAELRARHGKLRAPDAIQIATADLHEARVFLTNDAKLTGVGAAEVVLLSDFVA